MTQPSSGDIIKGFEAARANSIYYLGKALIDNLGAEKGRKILEETVWAMSSDSGSKARQGYEARGVENTWRNHRDANGPLYKLAWEGGIVHDEENHKIIEYSYCPLADGFTKLGSEAEEIGDIYCAHTDNAFWSGFNPEWTVTREKTFSKYGLCRLVWRKK
ncbi:MAG: L-2-amino-thiazoline-4-carboxylic acid hydrolase [Candidatus Bathyarchaeota archaeon]|nr:L-2-amino-thiazoline-4-carboxylic acid hydrolase [Candidatus Bathyarchaeota archaeon]